MMKSVLIRTLLLSLVVLFFALVKNGNAAFLGDIDQDDKIDLTDAILGLQVLGGSSPTIPQLMNDTDVDKDGKIGLPEVIYILKTVEKSNLALSHRAAMVGPLSGAAVSASRAVSGELVEGIKRANSSDANLQVAGSFDLALSGIEDNEWVVVAVTGGTDIDANGDSVVDPAPTANLGTIHALAKASDWRSNQLRITPLTELAWRYVEQLITEVPPEDVAIRQQDIARNLIKSDIDGNGIIDWYDILAFNPADGADRAKLATNYDWLSTEEDGYSILGTLRANDEEHMLARMDTTYSYLMTRFTVPDSRYHSVKVTLAVFGPGGASSAEPHALLVNSTLAQPVYEDSLYAAQNESAVVTFTATPADGAGILSWTGCDTVSANLSQCTVPLVKSQSVVVNFGRTATQLKAILHDLSRTNNYLGQNALAVLIPADMTDMIAEMATAATGHFVVGSDGGGFLRRITGITKVTPTNYMLDTVEAALDEVIAQGTGHLFKQMENSDLDGYVPPPPTGGSATVSAKAFSGLPGTTLLPSSNPESRKFTISLGSIENTDETMAIKSLSQEYEKIAVLYDDGQGSTLTATGTITLSIALDTGFDYDLFSSLNSFKFITIVDAEESVELVASAELDKFPLKKVPIGTIYFSPIPIPGLPLPVWVTPSVEVFLYAEGKIGAVATTGISFNQRLEGGLLYNKDTGFSTHKRFTSDYTPSPPSGNITASLKGGIEAVPALKIYDTLGPTIPLDSYLKIVASAPTEVAGNCTDIGVHFLAGVDAKFRWDLSGSSKLGQMLHLDELEEKTQFDLYSREWSVKKWTLLDTCLQGSQLLISGYGIISTITQGSSTGLSSTLTIKNSGDQVLQWNTSGIPPEVQVSPSSGELAPSEQTIVQMSLDASNLSVGHYLHNIFFFDQASVGQNLPDDQFGNTFRTVDVIVKDNLTDAPVIAMATSTNVGQVVLNWNFTNSESKPFIGFQIFATTTPDNPQTYKQIHSTDIYARSVLLSGLTPDSTYSIMIRAYSVTLPGPFSAPAAAKVAGSPPGIVVVSALSQAGSVFTVPKTGTYRFAIDGEAYVNSPNPDGGGRYTTKVLMYKNRAISWSASCYQSYPGPGNWDYELGTWNNYDTVRQAVAATEGEYLDIQLEEGDILTFIIQDCRDCCFWDNSGYTTVRVELLEPETCSDGIQNQGELAVDCGGPCGSCWKVYGCGMTSCTGTDPSVCGTAFSSQPLTVVPSVHRYLHCASVDVHLPNGSDFAGFYELLPGSVVITPLQ